MAARTAQKRGVTFNSPINFTILACDPLQAFATATQSLGMRLLRYPNQGSQRFWKNLIPSGTFLKNTGVQQTTFTISPSYPTDTESQWVDVTLDGASGQPTPACDTTYVDAGLDSYSRLYNPEQMRVRGPVLCREQFTYQHNIGPWLDSYVRELARFTNYKLEFHLRAKYMQFANWWSYSGGALTKTTGPNAQASVPIPSSGLTQDMIQQVSRDMIDLGVGTDENGYVIDGQAGKIFPLSIDIETSSYILRNNTALREDARFASMGMDGKGDTGLFRAFGTTAIIGNARHVPTNIAPRFNNVGGQLVEVTPFKTADEITPNLEQFTAAYRAARYEAAIFAVPQAYTAEWVTPYNWQFPDPSNYMGEWEFITGAERICNPPEYDPQHNKGRHFGKFVVAARPDFPNYAQVVVYKRCPSDLGTTSCPSYT